MSSITDANDLVFFYLLIYISTLTFLLRGRHMKLHIKEILQPNLHPVVLYTIVSIVSLYTFLSVIRISYFFGKKVTDTKRCKQFNTISMTCARRLIILTVICTYYFRYGDQKVSYLPSKNGYYQNQMGAASTNYKVSQFV